MSGSERVVDINSASDKGVRIVLAEIMSRLNLELVARRIGEPSSPHSFDELSVRERNT